MFENILQNMLGKLPPIFAAFHTYINKNKIIDFQSENIWSNTQEDIQLVTQKQFSRQCCMKNQTFVDLAYYYK